jgi:acyl-CoA synthetase (AMP-forming)/AMP-acid ligase II
VRTGEHHGGVAAILRAWAISRPDAPFLIDGEGDQTWTFAEFDAVTDAVARGLLRAGVRPGDRVGVMLPNGPEIVMLFLASLKIGAVFSPLNPAFTPDEIAFITANSDPRLVCTTTELAPKVTSTGAAPPPVVLVDAEASPWFRPAPGGLVVPLPDGDAPALILYTSGSTGRPKGAVLTHDNLLTNAREIASWLALGGGDRVLCVMPLFHANALVIGITTPLCCGGSSVVCRRFSATSFWSTVERHRPTTFGSVATILSILLTRGGSPPPRDRHRLRFALCGSAPVPAELIRRFREATGVPVIEGYGLTECTCRATFNPVADPRPGSVGLPIGNELRIVGDEGRECPPGEVGEILLRGRNVMAGYFRAPDATRHALRDGWLHTGDLGHRTEDGFVYVVGRKSDMIIRGGENIYPREIEDALYSLPGLEEAAVIGVPDPLYGEVVVACVAQDPARDLTRERILAHCRTHLAPFKIPTSVHLLDRLPRNATGKIDKQALRARLHPGPKKAQG